MVCAPSAFAARPVVPVPSAQLLGRSPSSLDDYQVDQDPTISTPTKSPFASSTPIPDMDAPPATNISDLPETLVSLIASRCDNPHAARKALHLTCKPLRHSICCTITRITIPAPHLLDPSTPWVYPSVDQLRVTCNDDPLPDASTPSPSLPPHLSRLVIRTSVSCPHTDTISPIIRASTNLPALSLTRSNSGKTNIESDNPLVTIARHCSNTLLSLTISHLSVSPHAAHTLAALTSLTHLDVKDCFPVEPMPALNALFSTLQQMTNLQSISAEAKSPAHLAALPSLPHLTALDLRPTTTSCKAARSLSSLAPLSTLHSLTLRSFHTDALSALLPNSQLASLHLKKCDVADADLSAIPSFPALTSLVLDSCQYEAGEDASANANHVTVGKFAEGLTSLHSSLKELEISTVPRFPLPNSVLTALTSLTNISVDRTELPSLAALPDHHWVGAGPLLPQLESFTDRTLAAGCKELSLVAHMPRLTAMKVASISEGIRARSIDPIHVEAPLSALRTLSVIEQPLVWRPEGMGPRWPLVLGSAAPSIQKLSIYLYGAAADDDLACVVENLPGLTSLAVKGEFSKGLWALMGLKGLRELSVLTLQDHMQEIVDVGVALSWQGLRRLACKKHKHVAKEMAARGKWGCTVASAGHW